MSRLLSFIGIQLPINESEKIREFQRYFQEKFMEKSTKLKPVHITLQPPFKTGEEDTQELKACLSEVRHNWQPFKAQIRNFGAFLPRVIYADVIKSPELDHLKNEITAQLREHAFLSARNRENEFEPHVTIATKGVNNKTFAQAWEFYKDIPFTCSWDVEGFIRYQHDGKSWQIGEIYDFTP